MENSLLLASLQLQKQREDDDDDEGKEGKEESAEVAESWIAASAAPWPPCTGFRGTLSVALAMKVPKPSSDS